jgi:hypothetical protein
MRSFFLLVFSCLSMSIAMAQSKDAKATTPDTNKKLQSVETACGECQLGLKGQHCDLAVRIDGKSYFVDGFKIDDFGDAHATDGFCNAVRKAEVQGEIVKGRFKATYFKLLPEEHKN